MDTSRTLSIPSHLFEVAVQVWAEARGLWGGRGLTTFASVGMAMVLVGVSGFSIWSSMSIYESGKQAMASSQLADHYASAASAVAAEESLERKYRLEPSPDVRGRFKKASTNLTTALALVRRDGNSQDRAMVDEVLALHVIYLRAIEDLFAAVDLGNSALVLRIDSDEVDPKFDEIEHTINGAAAGHHDEAMRLLADLGAQEALTARTTPAVFLAGMVFVLMFAVVLHRTRGQLNRQREQALHDSLHDALTGLPNRTLLADRLDKALRTVTSTGLMIIDLDRFKEINDTLGHHVGDKLLAEVGPRLAEALRAGDTVARLGGDEFAVLLPDIGDLATAVEVGKRVRKTLANSFRVEGTELDIDASIGVVVSSEHGNDAAMLLQRADMAMYIAKQQGRGVAAYDPHFDQHSPERLSMLGQLRRGMERGELFLHYQPKISLSTGEVTGVEALVRWQHPERGLVPPGDFIPLAEHTGLIGPLTMVVLDIALAQVKVWSEVGYRIPVAVNISARNLLDDQFAFKVAALLDLHQTPRGLLEVEVTESAAMLEPQRASQILNHLDNIGVRISIDDFGAGYTSLAQISTLPVSELKIDKSFILTMQSSRDNALIVRSIIDLGHSLKLSVVAEGVETADVASSLVEYGCDVAQGYYLCRPLAAEAFTHWYESRLEPLAPVGPAGRAGAFIHPRLPILKCA